MSLPLELFPRTTESVKLADPTKSVATTQTADSELIWKKELANATTSVAGLLEQLELGHHIKIADIRPEFKCLVTDSFINKMRVGDINDPLLRQILPLNQENHPKTQCKGTADPVGDSNAQMSQGLLHKYYGRALLISTGSCAVHCRYCFRRAYPYQQSSCTGKVLKEAVDYLNNHSEIEEIILSGGDPLIMDNEKLTGLITTLESVEHIQTLRIHTRLPVVLPNRINTGLVELLQSSRFQIVLVIHANHANELQDAELAKLHLLHKAGITLLNQSVLLEGINDNVEALTALSRRLFQCKTLPYYLHLLDHARGAMHFNVSKKSAVRLISQVEEQLPGYLVPRLVQEIAENKAKTAISRI